MQSLVRCFTRDIACKTLIKRTFAWVADPIFDEQNGWLIPISPRKSINVTEYNGRPVIQIREYLKADDGSRVPTKKGVFLSEDDYNALLQCTGMVDELIKKVKNGETS